MTTAVETPAASHAGPAAPAPTADVSPWRLLGVLGVGGVIAGALLVLVYGLTLPTIEANRARALHLAVNEVLKAPARYDTLYVAGGALVATAPAGVDPRTLERVYLGYGANDARVGFAMVAGEPGFQDVITLLFGFDPTTGSLTGMKVLESKETPGLGDRIEKDAAFVTQFDGARPPLLGVKKGKRTRPAEIDMVTGATISSRAVIRIINGKLERLRPLIDAYPEARTR